MTCTCIRRGTAHPVADPFCPVDGEPMPDVRVSRAWLWWRRNKRWAFPVALVVGAVLCWFGVAVVAVLIGPGS